MPDEEFAALARAVADEAFSENKLAVLREGSSTHYFVVGQVIAMIERLAFSADKLAALELMAPRILDRDQTYRIYGAFTFSADKDAARQILERQQPR